MINLTPEQSAKQLATLLAASESAVLDFKRISAKLRAELDGLVAHLYGLSEAEFVHILGTFPIVPDPVKIAAHNAYRDVARGMIL
jgi:hypothetical protein